MTDEFNIKITVKTAYLDAQSQPIKQRFAFSYTISIENCSAISTQLLSRHWIITDAKNNVHQVTGEGVIGKQPHILPGQKYTYSSHAVLPTHVGTMEGSYTMRADNGVLFEVPIPTFALARPQSLH